MYGRENEERKGKSEVVPPQKEGREEDGRRMEDRNVEREGIKEKIIGRKVENP